MTFSLVQSASTIGFTGATGTATFSASNAGGNCIVVLINQNTFSATVSVTSITDTAGNSYLPAGIGQDSGRGNGAQIAYVAAGINAAAAGNVVSVTFSNTNGGGIRIEEWSGVATSSAIRTSNSANAAGPSVPTVSLTGTVSGDLLRFWGTSDGGQNSAGSGMTLDGTLAQDSGEAASHALSAGGTVNVVGVSDTGWNAVGFALAPPGGGFTAATLVMADPAPRPGQRQTQILQSTEALDARVAPTIFEAPTWAVDVGRAAGPRPAPEIVAPLDVATTPAALQTFLDAPPLSAVARRPQSQSDTSFALTSAGLVDGIWIAPPTDLPPSPRRSRPLPDIPFVGSTLGWAPTSWVAWTNDATGARRPAVPAASTDVLSGTTGVFGGFLSWATDTLVPSKRAPGTSDVPFVGATLGWAPTEFQRWANDLLPPTRPTLPLGIADVFDRLGSAWPTYLQYVTDQPPAPGRPKPAETPWIGSSIGWAPTTWTPWADSFSLTRTPARALDSASPIDALTFGGSLSWSPAPDALVATARHAIGLDVAAAMDATVVAPTLGEYLDAPAVTIAPTRPSRSTDSAYVFDAATIPVATGFVPWTNDLPPPKTRSFSDVVQAIGRVSVVALREYVDGANVVPAPSRPIAALQAPFVGATLGWAPTSWMPWTTDLARTATSPRTPDPAWFADAAFGTFPSTWFPFASDLSANARPRSAPDTAWVADAALPPPPTTWLAFAPDASAPVRLRNAATIAWVPDATTPATTSWIPFAPDAPISIARATGGVQPVAPLDALGPTVTGFVPWTPDAGCSRWATGRAPLVADTLDATVPPSIAKYLAWADFAFAPHRNGLPPQLDAFAIGSRTAARPRLSPRLIPVMVTIGTIRRYLTVIALPPDKQITITPRE